MTTATHIVPDQTDSVWTTGMVNQHILPVGDSVARRALMGILQRAASTADADLRLLAELQLNDRVARVAAAVLHAADEDGNAPTTREDPANHGDIAGYIANRDAAMWEALRVLYALGLTDVGRPWLDGWSGADIDAVTGMVKALPDFTDWDKMWKDVDGILGRLPTPVLTLTALSDLVALGGEEPRLLKNRPRKFSEAALKDFAIEPEPGRWPADGLNTVLRAKLDETAAKTKQVKVTKTRVKDGKTIATLTLTGASPIVQIKATNLALCKIAFAVQDIPVPQPEVQEEN